MGVVSSPCPAETSADVALPCFDRTGSVQAVLHMQVLWQSNCEKAAVGSRGETKYGCDIWSGGTDYSAVDSPGGTTFKGGLSTA